MTRQEQFRILILGALRLPECGVDDHADQDIDKIAAFVAGYLAEQIEGVGWVSGRDPGWYVNVYEVTRCYGGPEEGGWYYNAGSPVTSLHCDTRIEAEQTKKKAEKDYAEMAWGNIYTVRGGVEISVRIEHFAAKPWPEKTPHYE